MKTLATLLMLCLISAHPANATDTPPAIVTELENTLNGIITSCRSSGDTDSCILTKIERKRSLYDVFLDKTVPAAWPEVDIVSFMFFHVARQVAQEQIHCNSLEASSKQSCLEQIPTLISDAREEARHLLIDKGGVYGKRQAMERNAQDRELQRQNVEAQLEMARQQALGMALFGSGAAMIQGMNQGFQNMQQPLQPMRPIAPSR